MHSQGGAVMLLALMLAVALGAALGVALLMVLAAHENKPNRRADPR